MLYKMNTLVYVFLTFVIFVLVVVDAHTDKDGLPIRQREYSSKEDVYIPLRIPIGDVTPSTSRDLPHQYTGENVDIYIPHTSSHCVTSKDCTDPSRSLETRDYVSILNRLIPQSKIHAKRILDYESTGDVMDLLFALMAVEGDCLRSPIQNKIVMLPSFPETFSPTLDEFITELVTTHNNIVFVSTPDYTNAYSSVITHSYMDTVQNAKMALVETVAYLSGVWSLEPKLLQNDLKRLLTQNENPEVETYRHIDIVPEICSQRDTKTKCLYDSKCRSFPILDLGCLPLEYCEFHDSKHERHICDSQKHCRYNVRTKRCEIDKFNSPLSVT